MAEQATIARPYAEAVFELARDSEQFEQWQSTLSFLREVISSEEIRAIIASPKSDKASIRQLLLDICAEHLQPQGINLLKMLVDNHRLDCISDIAEQYDTLQAEHQGSMKVELVSTYAVRTSQKKEIAAALGKRFGKEVELEVTIDRKLLGGWIVRTSNEVIDLSVRGRLDGLSADLRH